MLWKLSQDSPLKASGLMHRDLLHSNRRDQLLSACVTNNLNQL
jgi:hypothetical protein